MHDIVDLEARGLPGVFVATTEFESAADRQSQALGSAVGAVFVPHPIQDRRPEEVRALAEQALESILEYLLAPRG